ncbi:hypothetical protein ACOMHN_026438 [Nucella lapillus]
MNTSFVKLPACGPKPCYLMTQLKDGGKEGFDLTLTNGNKFWEGKITEEDLDAMSSNLKMDFTTYVRKTVAAFTRQNMADMNFVYQLKSQAEDDIDFHWKEEVGDIKILMGSAVLYEQGESPRALTALFTSFIDMTSDLQQRIAVLEADKQRLTQERQNDLKRLEKRVSAKENLEQSLYSKFVAVLNSKKEKIRNLQDGRGDAVDAVDSVADDPVPSTSGEAANGKRGRRKAAANDSLPSQGPSESADSEERDDQNTDDETPPAKRRPLVRKGGPAVDDDSSLNLDDGEDDSKAKGKQVVRRPARQRGGSKRQTPSRTVLPKVPSKSSDSGTRTPRRSSSRKSGSGPSSVDNVDTDDLLNDF